jgi:hypothetical protein
LAKPDPRREYLYVSKRLTSDVVKGASANTHNWGLSPSAGARGIGLSWFRREPAWENEIEIAQRATKVLADAELIGPLDPHTSADYVRSTLPLKCSVVDVHNPGFQVGLLTIDTVTAEWGRTLISLVGSPSNFRNRRNDNWRIPEECPSDIDGLMEIVRTAIEDIDREHFDDWDWDGHEPPIDAVIRMAEVLAKGRSKRQPQPRTLEFLAKVHFQLGNTAAWGGRDDYGLVLIGAALWAATPASSPLQ